MGDQIKKNTSTKAANDERKLKNGQSAYGFGLFHFIVVVLISAISSVSSVMIYDHYFATKIVSIDIKSYLDGQRKQYVANKLSNEQLNKNMDNIKNIIDNMPKNYVLLVNLPVPNEIGTMVVKNAQTIKLDNK